MSSSSSSSSSTTFELDDFTDSDMKYGNKELYTLLNRAKAAYLEVGGEVSGRKMSEKEMNTWAGRKQRLISHLFLIEKMVDQKNRFESTADEVETIKMKHRIRREWEDVVTEYTVLQKVHTLELKDAKMGEDERRTREEIMSNLKDEFDDLYIKIHGGKHKLDTRDESEIGTASGVENSILFDDLKKGNFKGAGVKQNYEEMSTDNMQQMAQIQQQNQQQDAILDEISKGLDALKNKAEAMGDELKLHAALLDDLDEKTDKTQTSMDKVNKRMKDAAETMNKNSGNLCLYGICFIILLGLASVLYKMLKK